MKQCFGFRRGTGHASYAGSAARLTPIGSTEPTTWKWIIPSAAAVNAAGSEGHVVQGWGGVGGQSIILIIQSGNQ